MNKVLLGLVFVLLIAAGCLTLRSDLYVFDGGSDHTNEREFCQVSPNYFEALDENMASSTLR